MICDIKEFCGIRFVTPAGLMFPFPTLEEYKGYCGPGRGLTEWIIPDTMYGLSISVPCFIHDQSWNLAQATGRDFAISNQMFLVNLVKVINHGTRFAPVKFLRLHRAMTYYAAVDGEKGRAVFDKLKGR